MLAKRVIVFDLHGTLAESRTKVDSEMVALLLRLLEKRDVAVVSGSTFQQFEAELLSPLLPASSGCPSNLLSRLYLFPSEGGEMYRWGGNWIKVYAVKLSTDDKRQIMEAFYSVFGEVDFLPDATFGETLQDRGSQITFAALGLDAPLTVKKGWDSDAKKRLVLKEKLAERLPEFEITVGGYTSMSVSHKGIDKSYCISRLLDFLGCEKSDVLYVGDRFFQGGDDFPVKAMGVDCIEVSNPEETKEFISDLLEQNET